MDENEFNQIYNEYGKLVRSVLYRTNPNGPLDDMTQEVFLKIWKNWKNFKGNSSLKTWIYKISLNTAFDFGKQQKPISLITELNVETSTNFQTHEMSDLIEKALSQLSQPLKSALVLDVYEDLSNSEISKILEIPEGTVKSRIHNAKKILHEILNKMGVHYECFK